MPVKAKTIRTAPTAMRAMRSVLPTLIFIAITPL
jgi:hypothetical protein